MAAGNDDLFRRACEGLNVLLLSDNKFSSTTLRAKNQVELKEILETNSPTDGRAVPGQETRRLAHRSTHTRKRSRTRRWNITVGQPLALPGGAATKTFVSPLVRE
jgi:hypothetical protein